MEKRLPQQPALPEGALDAILKRLARAPGAETPYATGGQPQPIPHWESLALLTPATRATELRRHLRGSLPLTGGPQVLRDRIRESLPLVFATAADLLAQPVSGDPRKAAAPPMGLLNALYELELTAIRDCCRKASDPTVLADCIEAALRTIWQLLLCYWLRQLAVPDRCWSDLHALYLLACATGIDQSDTTPPSPTARTVRTAYLQPLLMGSLNPTRYRPAEIKQIATFVEHHAGRARLHGASGLLRVDPHSSGPPGYEGRGIVGWRLCVRGLVQALDEASIDRPPLAARLARDLGRYWTRPQVRSEPHRRTDGWAELVFGLENVHRLLTGWHDDDNFFDHLAPTEPERPTPRMAGLLRARCIDRSATGSQFRVPGTPDQISPGALIAARAEGSTRLGMIRWTALTPDLDTTAGVQWLPDGAVPSAARKRSSAQPMPFVRAFLLPATAGDSAPELVVPAGIFKTAERVEILTDNSMLEVSLTSVADRTFHIARFATRPCASSMQTPAH